MKKGITVLIISAVATIISAGSVLPESKSEKAASSETHEINIVMPCETAYLRMISAEISEETTDTTETVEPETETPETAIFEESEAEVTEAETEEETEQYTESEIDSHVYYDIPLSKEDQAFTEDICAMYGLNHRYIFAQMQQESNFDQYCIGDGGLAIGILQIQPKWFQAEMQRLGITDLTNVRESVLLACDFMYSLLMKYGNYYDALTCYRYGDLTIDAENYAVIIFNYANELKEID